MSKKVVIAISIISILLASMLIYYSGIMLKPEFALESYNARKEDLLASQLRIERSLYELNKTIQTELEYQQALTTTVAELAAKADLPPPVVNKTTYVQQPPVIVSRPASSGSTPVTRAS